MMPRTIHWVTVAITAFIPWLITLAALGTADLLPRVVFVLAYYVLTVLVFGVAFAWYFNTYSGTESFTVMTLGLASVVVYTTVYVVVFGGADVWFLTWVDWIVPLFLTASTIYWVGKMFR